MAQFWGRGFSNFLLSISYSFLGEGEDLVDGKLQFGTKICGHFIEIWKQGFFKKLSSQCSGLCIFKIGAFLFHYFNNFVNVDTNVKISPFQNLLLRTCYSFLQIMS